MKFPNILTVSMNFRNTLNFFDTVSIMNFFTKFNFFYKFNFFHTMNIFKNMAKITICGFALVGMIACSSGGSGGSSTSNNGNNLVISNPSSVDVAENTTVVLTLDATADDGNAVTYTLGTGNDEDLFTITGNVLSFNTPPDFESPTCGNASNTCTVSIIASDGVNSTTQTITITVADVNSPQFTSDNTVSVPENTTDVITLVAIDDDDDPVTYTLGSGNDEDLFIITGNVLSFKTVPDFESPTCVNNTCTVSIIASDGVNETTQTITITVTNVNDNSPQFTSDNTASVAENTTFVITLVATDDDGDTITYTLDSTQDASLFDLSADVLSFKTAPNFESLTCSDNPCIVNVVASDTVDSTTQTITITVDDVNESPQFTSANTVSVPENTTDVITIVATDDDGDTITYTLDSNNDASLFDLSADVLSFKTAPDFETPACSDNTCIVNVVASDATSDTPQTITVIVTDECDDGYSLNLILECLPDSDNDGVFDTEDVDDDNDGLIEIHSLTMLHNVRHNLAGSNYKTSADDGGDSNGAPDSTPDICVEFNKSTNLCGYELMADLDFDGSDDDTTSWSESNGTYTLDSDDSNATYFNTSNGGWLPIGTTSDVFTGVFDGNGNTISNLAVMRENIRLGLFGQLAAGSVLRNLVIDNALIHALGNTAAYAGVFVGEALGTSSAVVRLQTLFATGSGAVIGNGAIENFLGGIVGNIIAPVITSSYSTVKVDGGSGGSNNVGGIVGSMTGGGNSSLYVAGLYATGAVTAGAGNSDNVGGVVGFLSSTILYDFYSTGDTDAGAGNTDSAGGLAGNINSTYVRNSYATGKR